VTPAELTGRAASHVEELESPRSTLHRLVRTPFLSMRAAAARSGFDLVPQSAYRDFERQLRIWNAKFNGEAQVNDSSGRPMDALALAPAARVDAILVWSALPGASRHHWGTDLDLIDRAAIPPGYRVALLAEEYEAAGPFGPVSAWLEGNAARFGFFRPYRGVRSGVQAEAWHFSFAPLAEPARRALTVAHLRAALCDAPLAGKDRVLERLDELHERYVERIDWP
jgi:LAS superfamily LD-carboxypeptidase LdcB